MTPRTPGFDADEVVEAAIDCFTAHGYQGTDTVRLCRDAGIARSSFYNTFKSKDVLFVRALGEYSRRGRELAAELPLAEGAALVRLRHRLLDDVLAQAADHSRAGCLSVNTAIEMGRELEEAAAILDADREAWVGSYALLLTQAAEAGDLLVVDDVVIRQRAAVLHTVLAGLRVAARVLDGAALAAQVDALLASWATEAGRALLTAQGERA